MKKLFLLIAVMAFMVHTAGAQMFNPVVFSVAENRITDTEIEIVFTGQVEEGGHVYGVDIPKNVWHNVECLESGSVIFEVKEGPFVPHDKDGILQINKI